MTLGEKLVQRRLELGLSQSQVAGTQITRNMLSQLEHDQASPSVKTLTYLATVLKVRISWLLEDNTMEPDVSVLEKARELYRQSNYRACMDVLHELPEQTDESTLLLHRCAVKVAECCLFDGKASEAGRLLVVAQKLSGLYLSAYDHFCVQKLQLACALADHDRVEEAAAELMAANDAFCQERDVKLLWAAYYLQKSAFAEAEEAIHAIPEQECSCVLYLRGILLHQTGEQDAAVRVLERAEHKGDLPRKWRQELYHILEQYYASRQNFQLAYRYAVLRME